MPCRTFRRALGVRAAVILAGFGLSLVLPAGTAAQATTFATIMRDTVLANGLHIIVVPNPTVPLVTIQVTIRNGAFTQLTEADEGQPHLLEHMLFRSGTFGEGAARLNAAYNGTTGDETVTYYLTLPSRNLDGGVRLLADLMREPKFDQAALTAEKRVVRGELERSASDPGYLLRSMVDQRLWGEARGRKSAIGNVFTINGATPATLARMYSRFYVPNNAAVVFSGDVAAASAFTSSARHFVRWRRSADPFEGLTLPPIAPLAAHHVVVAELEAQDVTLMVRWHGPSVRADPAATYAADVFASVVNDPVSDFQTRLVDSGLFQSVSLSYQTNAHVGPVTLYATTTADQVVPASRALRAELDRFGQPDYVSEEILEIAKRRQEVDWAMEMATPSGLASFIGELWSVADIEYPRGYLEAIQAQRLPDLARFVSTYLTDKPRVTGIMVSPITRRELGPRLNEALAPWRQ